MASHGLVSEKKREEYDWP